MKSKYTPWLRWWLFLSVTILSFFAFVYSGVCSEVYHADITKISFLIYLLFFVFTLRIGADTYRLCGPDCSFERYSKRNEMGWFVSDLLLTLGMIGTVVGFIYMLSTTFQQLDPSNIASMKGMIGKMGTGMGTALYTTASGLICSMLLRVQLYNMNQCINEVQDAVP